MTYITYSAYPPGCSGPPEDDAEWWCPCCEHLFRTADDRCPGCGWDARREERMRAEDAAADRAEDAL